MVFSMLLPMSPALNSVVQGPKSSPGRSCFAVMEDAPPLFLFQRSSRTPQSEFKKSRRDRAARYRTPFHRLHLDKPPGPLVVSWAASRPRSNSSLPLSESAGLSRLRSTLLSSRPLLSVHASGVKDPDCRLLRPPLSTLLCAARASLFYFSFFCGVEISSPSFFPSNFFVLARGDRPLR